MNSEKETFNMVMVQKMELEAVNAKLVETNKRLTDAMKEAVDNCETCQAVIDLEKLCKRCLTFLDLLGCYTLQLKKLSKKQLAELLKSLQSKVREEQHDTESLYSLCDKINDVRKEMSIRENKS